MPREGCGDIFRHEGMVCPFSMHSSLCIEGQSVTEGRTGKLGIISCLHYLHALMVYQAINAQARVALRLELLSEQCIPRVPSLAG